MSLPILIIGKSGSGKTHSALTLPPSETYYIQIIRKMLKNQTSYRESQGDVPGNLRIIHRNYAQVIKERNPRVFSAVAQSICQVMEVISSDPAYGHLKYIVIDDAQYLMALEALARANEKGFDKYNELAQNFMSIIATTTALRDDLTVFIMMHEEEVEYTIKGKTLGKLIDNQFTLEGFFDYVVRSTKRKTENGIEFLFETDNPNSTCKALTPLPSTLPNDLLNLIQSIRRMTNGS